MTRKYINPPGLFAHTLKGRLILLVHIVMIFAVTR